MPGRRLNDDERRLMDFWQNPPRNLQRPQLRSITIAGGTGLRGIDSLIIPFRYPITAICGKNGVGKSTILALAALAHHSPTGWFVHLGNTDPQQSQGDRTYYRFQNFFVQGRDEISPDGVEIIWRYFDQGQEASCSFKKTADRWGYYARRPSREVFYLGIGRALPAHETTYIRSVFGSSSSDTDTDVLSEEFINYLSYILERRYSLVELQKRSRYLFQRCSAEHRYTAFNMGSGETNLIILLSLLQKLPSGGLLVVDEIEIGLHPQAQVRLSEVLIRVCARKKFQLICTSHSEPFIDSLPRQARLLLRKSGEERSVIESPSTRFAMFELTGEMKPELVIYCEDIFAETIIREALPVDLLCRIKIVGVGSDSTVIRQGVAHLRAKYEIEALCILDGDCTEGDVKDWIRSEANADSNLTPKFLILPGSGQSPEKWLLEQLINPNYTTEFARKMGCSLADAVEHITAMSVQLDHHNIGYTLHNRTNLGETECVNRAVQSVAPRHPQLETLREWILRLMD